MTLAGWHSGQAVGGEGGLSVVLLFEGRLEGVYEVDSAMT